MEIDFKKVLVESVNGFVIALMIDLNAWCKSTPKGMPNEPFDWRLASKRWAAGAMVGFCKSIGWNASIVIDPDSAKQAVGFVTQHVAWIKAQAVVLFR